MIKHTDLTFFTNENGNSLLSRFKSTLKDTQLFDVLVGYFRGSGFYQLHKSLEAAFKVIEDLQNIVLPVRTLIVEKGSQFNLSLPAINYQADIEIAKNVYSINTNETNTISPVSIYFKDWTREGIQHAKPTGVPPEVYPNSDFLDRIKESPFSIDKATTGLNASYRDRGVAEITSEELLRNLTRTGDILFDILNP